MAAAQPVCNGAAYVGDTCSGLDSNGTIFVRDCLSTNPQQTLVCAKASDTNTATCVDSGALDDNTVIVDCVSQVVADKKKAQSGASGARPDAFQIMHLSQQAHVIGKSNARCMCGHKRSRM